MDNFMAVKSLPPGVAIPVQFIRIITPAPINHPSQQAVAVTSVQQSNVQEVGSGEEVGMYPNVKKEAQVMVMEQEEREPGMAMEQEEREREMFVEQEEREPEITVNCLFCYGPVENYDVDKLTKGILRTTSQRLLNYVCQHLNIDVLPDAVGIGVKSKMPKECRLHPHNLPLCLKCRERYYKGVYDRFVEYETAVARLHAEIGKSVTKTIGISVKENSDSTLGSEQSADDMISKYVNSINEHEVMKEVKRFRAKVAEKNPGGYVEDSLKEQPSSRQGSSSPVKRAQPTSTNRRNHNIIITRSSSLGAAATSTIQPIKPPATSENATSSTATAPKHLNIIKIVKKSHGPVRKENLSSEASNDGSNNKGAGDDDDDAEDEGPGSSDKSLSCYAVSNPEPGVIQIIPMNVASDVPSAPPRKRKNRREPRYEETRRQMYTCKYCNQYFAGVIKLNYHQVKVHGLEKPWACEKCDRRFIDKGSLGQHMIKHMDETEKEVYKKYACHLCPNKYRNKMGLDNHIRSHSGERPFTCETCGKSFSSKTSLNLCQDKHNGIKKHKCPFQNCDQLFLRREVLKIHMRQHSGERPFVCKLCGKSFAQRSPLRIHLKVHEKLGANYVPRPPRNIKVKKERT